MAIRMEVHKIANKISLFLICCTLSVISIAETNDRVKSVQCSEVSEASVHCGKTPSSIFDSQGRLWVVFEYQNYIYVSASKDKGKTFSKAVVVNQQAESIYTNGENRPKIELGAKGEIYISWTKKTAGRFNGDIRFSRSIDSGQSFSKPITINDDGLVTGHRFDGMKVSKDGAIFLSWIDKRDNHKTKKNKTVARKGMKQNGAIYTSFSVDSGQSFSKNERLAESSCVCCRIAMTATSDNAMAISWRHVYPDSIRDHAFAIIDTKGIKQPPTRVSKDNWKIEACPHHGPSVTEDKNSELHLVWFTASSSRKGIYYGRLNSQAAEADNLVNLSNLPSASHPYIISNDDQLMVVWKEFDGEKTQIIKVLSHDFGKSWGPKAVVTETSGESDHPFLVRYDNQAWLSWLTENEGLKLSQIEG